MFLMGMAFLLESSFSIENVTLTLAIIFILNLIIFVLKYVVDKVSNRILKYLDMKKKKNTSLFDWIGEHNDWLLIFKEIDSVKNFDNIDIVKNFDLIKSKIKLQYDTKEKLQYLKIYLQSRVESPKLNTLNTSINSILIPIIILSLSTYVNGFNNSTPNVIYIFVFMVFWVLLLVVNKYLGDQMNKYKLILKLVEQCIEEIN